MALYLLLWFFFLRINIPEAAVTVDSDTQYLICNSCSKGGVPTSCYCDNMCTFYKDCCFDAPTDTNKGLVATNVRPICLPLSFRKAVYVVDECPSSWNGPADVQTKCNNHGDFQEDIGDLMVEVPVTDLKTNITYRNRYCAECNGAEPINLSSFLLELNCDELLEEVNNSFGNISQDFILQNIIYRDYSWGVNHWDHRSGGMSFSRCFSQPQIPGTLSFLVRECQPSITSTCAPDWTDVFTHHCCLSSHTNIVYDKYGGAYRNSYCAICNNISNTNIRCEPPMFDIDVSIAAVPQPSFRILLDINSTNQSRCSPTQIYDSASDKCRRLICTDPDEVPRNGKCVKPEGNP